MVVGEPLGKDDTPSAQCHRCFGFHSDRGFPGWRARASTHHHYLEAELAPEPQARHQADISALAAHGPYRTIPVDGLSPVIVVVVEIEIEIVVGSHRSGSSRWDPSRLVGELEW